jgi:hypothetical protein
MEKYIPALYSIFEELGVSHLVIHFFAHRPLRETMLDGG